MFFCKSFPASFGPFPDTTPSAACPAITPHGVSKTITSVEIGPIASGAYSLEFTVGNGAGGFLNGGNICEVDFQAPGPICGNAVTIKVP